jgi:site-specific recombinase XerC
MGGRSRVEIAGPLAPFADGFVVELLELGYTRGSKAMHVGLFKDLSRWLVDEGVEPGELVAAVVDRFESTAVSRARWHMSPRGLELLLGYLRRVGVVPAPPAIVEQPDGPQCAPSGDPIALPVRRVAPPRVLRPDPGVLAVPSKRYDQRIVTYLSKQEANALLAAPDRTTWTGRRDHALLLLAVQTGLRASELTGLACDDVHLGTTAHVTCTGKGRKNRVTPLTRPTARILRVWLAECQGSPGDPLFPTTAGRRLSRDALEHCLAKYVPIAADRCPSLREKRITMHVLRHTAAIRLLHAGIDSSVIAPWLGHASPNTTQIYLDADLELKQRALDRTAPPDSKPGRYQPPDALLAFLKNL